MYSTSLACVDFFRSCGSRRDKRKLAVQCISFRDLYLDGNSLECEGAIELIKLFADTAEMEAIERAEKKDTDTADANALTVPGVSSAMATASRPTSSVSVKSKPPRLENEPCVVTISKVIEEIKSFLLCFRKIISLRRCRWRCRRGILNSALTP